MTGSGEGYFYLHRLATGPPSASLRMLPPERIPRWRVRGRPTLKAVKRRA